MRVLLKNKENDFFCAVEANTVELDSPNGGIVIFCELESYLIAGISRKKSEELIREAYVSGRVDLTAWPAECMDLDDLLDPEDFFDMDSEDLFGTKREGEIIDFKK